MNSEVSERICGIFHKIQTEGSVSNKLIMEVIQMMGENQNQSKIIQSLQQCYLKICRQLGVMKNTNKKSVENFHRFTERLFGRLFSEYVQKSKKSDEMEIEEDKRKNKGIEIEVQFVMGLFHNFLLFFCQGLDTQRIQVQAFCVRALMSLLAILQQENTLYSGLNKVLDNKILQALLEGALELMDNRYFKTMGIKLASYLQSIESQDNHLQLLAKALQVQMVKCMTEDSSKEVRKIAMTNLSLATANNVKYLLPRIRDNDKDIRKLVFDKLRMDEVYLEKHSSCMTYQLLVKGVTSRHESIRRACLAYYKANFNGFSKVKGEEEDVRQRVQDFLSQFEVDSILLQRGIQPSVEVIVKHLLTDFLSPSQCLSYINLLLALLNSHNGKKPLPLTDHELLLLKVIAHMTSQQLSNNNQYTSIKPVLDIVDDKFPGGHQFCQVMQQLYRDKRLFGLRVSLQTISQFLNYDVKGREQLLKSLESMVLCIVDLRIDIQYYNNRQQGLFNEVLEQMSEGQLEMVKLSQEIHDQTIVSQFEDLLQEVIVLYSQALDTNNETVRLSSFMKLISDLQEVKRQNEEDIQETINKQNTIRSKMSNNLDRGEIVYLQERLDELEQQYQQLQEYHSILKYRLIRVKCSVLQNISLNYKNPTLNRLANELISHIKKEEGINKAWHIKAFGLFMVLNKDTVHEYHRLFVNMVQEQVLSVTDSQHQMESSHVYVIAIQVLFDMFVLQETAQIDAAQVVDMLMHSMMKSDPQGVYLHVQGFIKLLFLNRLPSHTPQILTLFILLWNDQQLSLHPLYGIRVIQSLTHFFRLYNKQGLNHAYVLENAFENFIELALHFKQHPHLRLNSHYVSLKVNEKLLERMTQIGIQLLAYGPNKHNQYIKDLQSHQNSFLQSQLLDDPQALRQDLSLSTEQQYYQQPPLEKFFLYLSHQLWHHKTNTLHQALIKNLYNFDFIDFDNTHPQSSLDTQSYTNNDDKARLKYLHVYWIRSYIINIINTMDSSKEKTMVVKIKTLKTYLEKLDQELNKIEKSVRKNKHTGEMFSKECFQIMNQNWEKYFQQRRSDLISLFNNLKSYNIITSEGQGQDMDDNYNFPDINLIDQSIQEEKSDYQSEVQNIVDKQDPIIIEANEESAVIEEVNKLSINDEVIKKVNKVNAKKQKNVKIDQEFIRESIKTEKQEDVKNKRVTRSRKQ